MPTCVALSAHFESFIREQINGGRYNNVSEVVRAGLRMLEETERQHAIEFLSLRAGLAAGQTSSGEQVAEPLLDRMQAKYLQKINAKKLPA
jgi:antitoxin ParD1/3/4